MVVKSIAWWTVDENELPARSWQGRCPTAAPQPPCVQESVGLQVALQPHMIHLVLRQDARRSTMCPNIRTADGMQSTRMFLPPKVADSAVPVIFSWCPFLKGCLGEARDPSRQARPEFTRPMLQSLARHRDVLNALGVALTAAHSHSRRPLRLLLSFQPAVYTPGTLSLCCGTSSNCPQLMVCDVASDPVGLGRRKSFLLKRQNP